MSKKPGDTKNKKTKLNQTYTYASVGQKHSLTVTPWHHRVSVAVMNIQEEHSSFQRNCRLAFFSGCAETKAQKATNPGREPAGGACGPVPLRPCPAAALSRCGPVPPRPCPAPAPAQKPAPVKHCSLHPPLPQPSKIREWNPGVKTQLSEEQGGWIFKDLAHERDLFQRDTKAIRLSIKTSVLTLQTVN